MIKQCLSCKKDFRVKPSHFDRRKFCSQECHSIYRINKISVDCEICNKSFLIVESRLKFGRGKYCSSACQYEYIRTKEKSFVECDCLKCGSKFKLYPSSKNNKKGAGKYCSRLCRDEHRIAEMHPQFIDGAGINRGYNWQSQKRKVLKRDNYTCKKCGISSKESVIKNNHPLHVHHIVPYRFYGDNYKEANKLSNLVSLCPPCHRIEDAKIQKLEKSKS